MTVEVGSLWKRQGDRKVVRVVSVDGDKVRTENVVMPNGQAPTRAIRGEYMRIDFAGEADWSTTWAYFVPATEADATPIGTDIVDRLRADGRKMQVEAAYEIERLRALLDEAKR